MIKEIDINTFIETADYLAKLNQYTLIEQSVSPTKRLSN